MHKFQVIDSPLYPMISIGSGNAGFKKIFEYHLLSQ
jgi:hypothetical protein